MSPNVSAASLRPRINRTIGVSALAASAAAEEVRVMNATASQTMAKASAACQATARRQPRKVATPFPPLNFSQAGNKWPRKAPSAARRMGTPCAKWATTQYRDGPLQEIEEKGQRGQVLAAGAKNVGRANITGTDRVEICSARRARQDEAKRNCAASIAEQKGENALKHAGKPFDGRKTAT